MPETGAEAALARPRCLHRALMETRFRMKNGLRAERERQRRPGHRARRRHPVHAIIGAADARMYAVKTDGRGQVWRSVEARYSLSSPVFVALIFGELLQLIPPVQRLDERPRLAPAGLDNDMQLQIDARAQQRLDLLARAGADLLQLRSALADQNGLLPVALAVDGGGNARQRELAGVPFLPRRRRLRLFIALDHHRRGVGNLFAGLDQDALADQLGHHEAHGLVGVLILGIVALARRAAHRRSCAAARRGRPSCARSPG